MKIKTFSLFAIFMLCAFFTHAQTSAPKKVSTRKPVHFVTPPIVDTVMAVASKVNINTATKAELKTLPGITDAYASKIILGRPYTNANQLLSKKIIPAANYNRVKNLIITK